MFLLVPFRGYFLFGQRNKEIYAHQVTHQNVVLEKLFNNTIGGPSRIRRMKVPEAGGTLPYHLPLM